MTYHFWDTSALAKLYFPEPGSAWAAATAARDEIAISRITLTELASVLGRRFREGEFDEQERDLIYDRFLLDVKDFALVEPTDVLLAEAGRLLLSGVAGSRLRTLDAIQLASAREWFRRADAANMAPGAFVVADAALRDAAATLHLRVENPEDHQ